MTEPSVTFTVRLPAADAASLAVLAKRYERTMSFLVRDAVRLYLATDTARQWLAEEVQA